ncbi:MAG: site-specific DNA-methyltransferase, partial [Deltaproteobacteria bacterium]|nr:site-specific DNA-methyltransferase [Deltaproteobacteria bacterium]
MRQPSSSPNRLFHGDAGAVLAALPQDEALDLVYLDPPYAVGTVMTMRERAGESRGRKRTGSGRDAYVDGRGVDALIAMLVPVFDAVRARMSAAASFYLHMDWRAVHDAKVAADRVFGRRAFVGEVIWTPGNGSRGARGFAVTHQTLLVYA